MDTCPGTSQEGELRFIDGWEEWYVICRVCGAKWAGGSSSVPEHEPVGTQRPSTKRSRIPGAQGAAEHLAALLSILKVVSDDDPVVGMDEFDHITLHPDTAWELYLVLTDLLPRCWNAQTWYGYPAPEDCTMPERLCDTCVADGRRPPRPQRAST